MTLLLDANVLLDFLILESSGMPRAGKDASEQILDERFDHRQRDGKRSRAIGKIRLGRDAHEARRHGGSKAADLGSGDRLFKPSPVESVMALILPVDIQA